LVFICIALTPGYNTSATILFIYACLTDLLDGYFARKFSCTSKIGGALDLFSDKYLTIISFIYAIASGIPVLPCSIGILREIFLLSMRSIQVDGKPIFPPQRILGTLMVIPIWSGTVLLIHHLHFVNLSWNFFLGYYWTLGVLSAINLGYKINGNWKLLIKSFKQ
jgi:phosphatidylglycerophosphate synthase